MSSPDIISTFKVGDRIRSNLDGHTPTGNTYFAVIQDLSPQSYPKLWLVEREDTKNLWYLDPKSLGEKNVILEHAPICPTPACQELHRKYQNFLTKLESLKSLL